MKNEICLSHFLLVFFSLFALLLLFQYLSLLFCLIEEVFVRSLLQFTSKLRVFSLCVS